MGLFHCIKAFHEEQVRFNKKKLLAGRLKEKSSLQPIEFLEIFTFKMKKVYMRANVWWNKHKIDSTVYSQAKKIFIVYILYYKKA